MDEILREDYKFTIPVKYYDINYTSIRRAKILMFNLCLTPYTKYTSMKYEDKINMLSELEESCYQVTCRKSIDENITIDWKNDIFVELYHSICSKVAYNLDYTSSVSNDKLANKVFSNEINIQELPKMSSVEMYPEKYESILIKIDMTKQVVQTVKTTTLYECGRCHSRQCTIANLYNRSLDEGVNVVVTCMLCTHQWNN